MRRLRHCCTLPTVGRCTRAAPEDPPAPSHCLVSHADDPGEAIAVAIESLNAAERMADHPSIEVVCTGPDSPLSPMRLTSEVVLDLVNSATERLTICSFSSYKVAAVVEALDTAVKRGVRVDLVLESQSHLDGGGGAEGFEGHRVFVWPDELRPPNASLHAKAVIADSHDVLLTSANLSNAAFNRNLETWRPDPRWRRRRLHPTALRRPHRL